MRAFLALGICVAVLVSGCGGDSDTASTASSAETTTATTQATATNAPPASQQSAGGQREDQAQKPDGGSATKQGGTGNGSAKGGSAPHIATVKVPPISSAPVAGTKAPAPGVKTVKGADDSVQTYGTESGEAARTEATIALAAYLDARNREDWASACEALAQRPTEQLEKLAKSLSAQGKETSGCAAAMAALGQGGTSGSPPATTITEVLSLRSGGEIPGDPSYLIFSGPPGQTLYSMPMYLEGGWKVGLAVPAELPL